MNTKKRNRLLRLDARMTPPERRSGDMQLDHGHVP